MGRIADLRKASLDVSTTPEDRKSGDLPESCFTHLFSRESSGTAYSNILLDEEDRSAAEDIESLHEITGLDLHDMSPYPLFLGADCELATCNQKL